MGKPVMGFEPATHALQKRCSTTELHRHKNTISQKSRAQKSRGIPTDILSEVSLESFNANPTAIGPFGTSVLSWRVTGPTSGFHVELNQQTVVRSGEQVVQPVNTTTYRLTANARGVSELLGSVQVAADRSSCQINPGGNALSTIQGPIYANITGDYTVTSEQAHRCFSQSRCGH